MTTAASTLLGRPVWYELMTTDMAAAEAFYKNVVGWTSNPFEGSPEPYTLFKRSGDVGVAGLLKVPEGPCSHNTKSGTSGPRSARRGAGQVAPNSG